MYITILNIFRTYIYSSIYFGVECTKIAVGISLTLCSSLRLRNALARFTVLYRWVMVRHAT